MARKVFPERNMRHSHPYDIWKALLRLQVYDKLADNPNEHYNCFDIGKMMFSNWNDLTVREQMLVNINKTKFPLRCLKIMRYVEESILTDRWKPVTIPFQTIISKDEQDRLTRMIIDDYWRSYKGRP